MSDRTLPSNVDQGHLSPVALMLLGIGIVVVLILAWLGRVILLLLFAAVVAAVVLTAVVDWLKATFKIRQTVAFALILCLGTGIVTVALWLIGPQIIAQFESLQTDLPQAFRQLVANGGGERA